MTPIDVTNFGWDIVYLQNCLFWANPRSEPIPSLAGNYRISHTVLFLSGLFNQDLFSKTVFLGSLPASIHDFVGVSTEKFNSWSVRCQIVAPLSAVRTLPHATVSFSFFLAWRIFLQNQTKSILRMRMLFFTYEWMMRKSSTCAAMKIASRPSFPTSSKP